MERMMEKKRNQQKHHQDIYIRLTKLFLWFEIVLSLWSVAYKHKFTQTFLEMSNPELIFWVVNKWFIPSNFCGSVQSFQCISAFPPMLLGANILKMHQRVTDHQIIQPHPAKEKPRGVQWKELITGNFPGKKKCYSGGEKAAQPDCPETAGHNYKKAKAFLSFSPLFDIVCLAGITWYSVSSSYSYTPTRTMKFAIHRSENLVPKHSCVANLCTEIYQPKHMKKKRSYFAQRGIYIIKLAHIVLQGVSFKHVEEK